MDPVGLGEFLAALVGHKHVRSGIALALTLIGVTTIRWSADVAMPQELILAALGIGFAVSGGIYVIWKVWER